MSERKRAKNLDDQMAEYGFDPAAERLNVLPNPNGSLDPRDWTAPAWLYSAAKAAAIPGLLQDGGEIKARDVTEAALNVGMLGGVAGMASAPKGALAMGAAKSKAAREIMKEQYGIDLSLTDFEQRMAAAKEQGYQYVRRSKNADTPINEGVGYAMFKQADDPELGLEQLKSYGPHGWLATGDEAVPAEDLMKEFTRALRRRGIHNDYQTTAAALARQTAPEDIVDSAGAWDAPDIVEALWEDVLQPRRIMSIRTPDGLIKFDHSNLRRSDAAFDPAKRDSADLLAANASPGLSTVASGAGGDKAMTTEEAAAMGRNGDTALAHVTPGEVVIPHSLQTPRVMGLLEEEAAARGRDLERYVVGHPKGPRNPHTLWEEFFDGGDGPGDSDSGATGGGIGGPGDGGDGGGDHDSAPGKGDNGTGIGVADTGMFGGLFDGMFDAPNGRSLGVVGTGIGMIAGPVGLAMSIGNMASRAAAEYGLSVDASPPDAAASGAELPAVNALRPTPPRPMATRRNAGLFGTPAVPTPTPWRRFS